MVKTLLSDVDHATKAYGLPIDNLNMKLKSGGLEFDALKSKIKGITFWSAVRNRTVYRDLQSRA